MIECFSNSPGLRIRAEVFRFGNIPLTRYKYARYFFTESNDEIGVTLVVPKLDVEGRVELLDPGEFELEGFKFGADGRPLHPVRTRDHTPGALMQSLQRREIAGETCPKVLGFANVEDSFMGIEESVNPR